MGAIAMTTEKVLRETVKLGTQKLEHHRVGVRLILIMQIKKRKIKAEGEGEERTEEEKRQGKRRNYSQLTGEIKT